MMTNSMPAVAESEERFRVQTRFGDLEASAADVVSFPEGLPGFERNHQFVLVSSEELTPLHCLHAIDGPPASFLVVDPRLALPRYRCSLTSKDLTRLGATTDSSLLWLALVTIDADEQAWVNLRAPVVVNATRMVGFQVIPSHTLYPLRHPLSMGDE